MSNYNSTQKPKSPLKQVKFMESPQKNDTTKKFFDLQNQTKDFNVWKIRCQELEYQILQMNIEVELANYKLKKQIELESRIKQILKQNSQLLGENDCLSKECNLKKNESEIWKSKYENQMNTIIGLKANYELELKKKQAQIEKNLDTIKILELQCNQDIESLKQKQFQDQSEQIQNLKHNHIQNTQLYEEQIRKLQDVIQSRDQDIDELKNQLITIKNENESEYIRLNDEIEKNRKQIQQMEMEQQQQQQIIRNKKDQQYDQQILSIKKLHTNEIDTYEAELSKLKVLIQSKNEEINIQILQNRIQKENFDILHKELKQEINTLKDKLSEINECKEDEITNLKEKLAHLHTIDINELKKKNEQYFNLLKEEIQRLSDLIVLKQKELNEHQKETQELINNFTIENDRLQSEIVLQKNRLNELQDQKQNIISEQSNNQQKTNQTHENFSEQMKNQIKFLEDQIDSLKECIVKKNKEIDENIAKHKTIKHTLEEDIRNLRHLNSDLKKQLDNCKYDLEKQCEEKDHKINIINTQFNQVERELERQIDEQNIQIKELKGNIQLFQQKENISHIESDNKNNIILKQQIEQDNKRQRNSIEKLNEKIIQMDLIKAIELEEFRKKLENTNHFHLNSMKESTQNQIKVLTQHLEEHKAIIKNKETEVQDVLLKQTKLQGMFEELAQNTNKFGPDYQQKIQKLGAEILTTKNIYEIFMQSKKKYSRKQSIQ